MINAVITRTSLGFDTKGIPFAIFEFEFNDGNEKNVRVSTIPITLFKEGEALTQSALAEVLVTLLSIAGSPEWEQLPGKPVRIEIEDGVVTKISHFINDFFIEIQKKEINGSDSVDFMGVDLAKDEETPESVDFEDVEVVTE